MITFTKQAWQKCQALVDVFPEEVGWHGFCTMDNNYNVTIQDIYCSAHQRTSAGNCTILHEGDNELIDWEDEMRALYGNGAVRAWFHSHHNMGVGPSSQDDKQLKELSEGQPYYLRIIMNKKGDVGITISLMGYEAKVSEFNVEGDTNIYSEWANSLLKEINKNKPVVIINNNYGKIPSVKDNTLYGNNYQSTLDDYYDTYWRR